MEGIVVRLFPDKRFGFIKATDGKEYFFHQTDMNGFFDDLVEDYEKKQVIHVGFESLPDSPKGPRACRVQRLDWPNETTV